MFGICIMMRLTSSRTTDSFSSISFNSSAIEATCCLTASASSLFPSFISPPICLLIALRCARRSSTRCFMLRSSLSLTMTSSTSGSLWSWNFLRMFSLTASGCSLKNLISSIQFLLIQKKKHLPKRDECLVLPPFLFPQKRKSLKAITVLPENSYI